MTDILIHLASLPSEDAGDVRGLSIRAKGVVLTSLLREELNEPDDFVRVPAARFGFWLVDNWWRLRWECRPPNGITLEWRQAHDLASIGGGYAWPRVTLWGEGARMVIIGRADPPGMVGPVRFLQDAITFVDATEDEAAIDRVLVECAHAASGEDHTALSALIDALIAERVDPEATNWRRLEAMAGFDPDRAPEAMIDQLQALTEQFDRRDVEEAVSAAPGPHSAQTLNTMLNQTPDSVFANVSFNAAVNISGHQPGAISDSWQLPSVGNEPWRLAEAVASRLRAALGVGAMPLRNKRVAELVDTPPTLFRTRPAEGKREQLPYGLRLQSSRGDGQKVLLRARWSHDRRFELMRTLGDAIWTEISSFGPTSLAATARQKFQRAFAASLLCPASGLMSFLGIDNPSDEDISAAARYFHVSERVVRSVLVNKRLMERERLHIPFDDLRANEPVEELADAA